MLAANHVETVIQRDDGFTPTPSISRAILAYNRKRKDHLADGIVVTPSHNPPADGGFKYNPPEGGPADTDITDWIQDRANELLRTGNPDVKRVSYGVALQASTTQQEDLLRPYVDDLSAVIDMDAIRSARVKLGVDPLGGAALGYWENIGERYRLELTVVNKKVDPTFRFMTSIPANYYAPPTKPCTARKTPGATGSSATARKKKTENTVLKTKVRHNFKLLIHHTSPWPCLP